MSSNTDNNADLEGIDFDSLPAPEETLENGASMTEPGQGPQQQIELLESQLQEKEDLVFALTERLEQAAEQLDRYRRAGARQSRSGGGMPKEIVEEQKSLFDEMRQMIAQWEATQPGVTLGRIELQVTELRDLVAGNVLGDGNGGGGIGSALSALTKSEPAPAAEEPQEAAAAPSNDFKPGSWEAQRAALMAGEPVPESKPEPVAEVEVPATETDDVVEEAAEDLTNTPTPIDLHSADIEQLRQAVQERDRIIASLKQQIEEQEGSGEVVKFDTMDSMPDEFREKLDALEEEWKDKIRETEVELSLERAKIAREKAELQQQQHQMQKHREKMGVTGQPGPANSGSQSGEDANSGRWLRFLKRGNDDE
ncbi:hypothetical protein CA54_23580 [Symmachiella macrocystis]|uniref:Uncharacterized protein n=1 Tax=Symmachiella macrocystis TaxID=2527985 RepID=A0A5C6BMZ6_9PLAN|nr:hypothetical protein [Symmachiella macrocystis]TWU13523.1 hypothetical protein CA54_23580 [Symmachiella macrocystis]